MTERLLQLRWWDIENWPVLAVAIGVPLAKAAILVLLTWGAARLARSWFDFATERTGADAHVRLIIGRTVAIVIFILGGITVLDTLGVPPATLVTFVGVVGIGISLALQDILKSFFAGTYLLFERPFRIGDEISVKDQRGIVEHIGIRTTRLRTEANVLVAIPNAVVFSEMVLNRTNERKPADARVAADNERAAPPAAGTDGRADQPACVDGAATGATGRPSAEPARPATASFSATVSLFAAARFVRSGVLRPVARGLAASAASTAQVVPFVGRPELASAASRVTGWLPRVRSLARTALDR